MKKYIIQKDTFTGSINVLYDSNDRLLYINFEECQISDELRESYKKHIPITVEGLSHFNKYAKASIIPIKINITFEMWYDLFGMPRNKERALKHWDKLSQNDRVIAFYNTKKYLRYCQRNSDWYNKLYPDSFLSPVNRHYLTDWDQVKH
ncbi:hypothetical protein ABDK00_001540 [Niabella insulamsoli]|uniref:hypothetical protein n=1 Tax=Niabella insulamsoli TaxID=3144874 RepID=UPI0031FBE6DF